MLIRPALALALAGTLIIALCSSSRGAQNRPRRVAFLIGDGTVVLDYTGAYEVFAQAGMRVFTVAKTRDAVKLSSNLRVIPNHSLEDAPEADILVIPGGGPDAARDTSTLRWIRARSGTARYVLTVCGGVFPAYAAGLLDGDTATTYGPLIDHLRAFAPRTTVVADRRFVDNGKVVTAGSYVAGIDAALYIVSRLDGEPRAQEIANNIEYDWDRQYRYVRARLADNWLAPLLDFHPPLNGRTLKYEGDDTLWVAEYEVDRDGPLESLTSQIPGMAAMHHWTNRAMRETADSHASEWTREALDRGTWSCSMTIARVEGAPNRYRLSYRVSRR